MVVMLWQLKHPPGELGDDTLGDENPMIEGTLSWYTSHGWRTNDWGTCWWHWETWWCHTPPTENLLRPSAKKRARVPKEKLKPERKSKPVAKPKQAAHKDATSKKKGTQDNAKSTTKNSAKDSAKNSAKNNAKNNAKKPSKAACKPKAKAKSKTTARGASRKQSKKHDDWVKRKLHCVAQLPTEYVFFSIWICAQANYVLKCECPKFYFCQLFLSVLQGILCWVVGSKEWGFVTARGESCWYGIPGVSAWGQTLNPILLMLWLFVENFLSLEPLPETILLLEPLPETILLLEPWPEAILGGLLSMVHVIIRLWESIWLSLGWCEPA